MAVPTITSVSPSYGHTGGTGLVEIRGTGFQVWQIPPFEGRPSGPMWPTVSVQFGSSFGRDVSVVSPYRLYVRPPRSPFPVKRPGYGEGTVDVTVRNLLRTGSAIAGEQATASAAYAYRRANLSDESVFSRLTRTVVRELRLQVIDNVAVSSHSDFDLQTTDMLNVIDVAQLPALVLFGPGIVENTFYRNHGKVYYDPHQPNHEAYRYDAAETDDVMFGFVGISDQKQEAVELQASVRMFFRHNRKLALDRDPESFQAGQVYYEIFLDGQQGLSWTLPPDQKSNLKTFSGMFTIRGFDWEALAGFERSDRVAKSRHVTLDQPCGVGDPEYVYTKDILSLTFPYAEDPITLGNKDILSFTFPYASDPGPTNAKDITSFTFPYGDGPGPAASTNDITSFTLSPDPLASTKDITSFTLL